MRMLQQHKCLCWRSHSELLFLMMTDLLYPATKKKWRGIMLYPPNFECPSVRRPSVCLSVCPSALRFRALTLVPFDLKKKKKKKRQKIPFLKNFWKKAFPRILFFHAVVFYVAYTNIINIYGVEKWEFARIFLLRFDGNIDGIYSHTYPMQHYPTTSNSLELCKLIKITFFFEGWGL